MKKKNIKILFLIYLTATHVRSDAGTVYNLVCPPCYVTTSYLEATFEPNFSITEYFPHFVFSLTLVGLSHLPEARLRNYIRFSGTCLAIFCFIVKHFNNSVF